MFCWDTPFLMIIIIKNIFMSNYVQHNHLVSAHTHLNISVYFVIYNIFQLNTISIGMSSQPPLSVHQVFSTLLLQLVQIVGNIDTTWTF